MPWRKERTGHKQHHNKAKLRANSDAVLDDCSLVVSGQCFKQCPDEHARSPSYRTGMPPSEATAPVSPEHSVPISRSMKYHSLSGLARFGSLQNGQRSSRLQWIRETTILLYKPSETTKCLLPILRSPRTALISHLPRFSGVPALPSTSRSRASNGPHSLS
jgi:hypothetical protein